MTSKKFLFVLILFSITILISKVEAGIPVHCQCVKSDTGTVSDCTTGSNCAVEISSGFYSTGSCIIIKQDCNCNPNAFCDGERPCCFSGGKGTDDNFVDSCEDNYAICQKDYKCPDTGDYNGNVCELVDDCTFSFVDAVCVRKTGRWDASQRRCVECDSKKQGKVIIDNITRYMDVKNDNDCVNEKWTDKASGTIEMTHDCQGYKDRDDLWGCKGDPCCEYLDSIWPGAWGCKKRNCNEMDMNENTAISQCGCSPGASRDVNTCESACGADTDCDEIEAGKRCCSSDCYCLDVDGKGKIDILDIATVAKAYGSYPGHSRWNLVADVNHNGVVDIIDIATVAKAYGQSCGEGTTSLGFDYFSMVAILITIILIVIIFGFFKVFVKKM